jgi:hypothetical protein
MARPDIEILADALETLAQMAKCARADATRACLREAARQLTAMAEDEVCRADLELAMARSAGRPRQ